MHGLIVGLLPDNRDLLAYDELRQYGLSNVLKAVARPGFFSDTSCDSDESIEHGCKE
jgi:hypothetical protein